jgi:hypothetical protein
MAGASTVWLFVGSPSAFPTAVSRVSCGVERWSVKTLTDEDAASVNLKPKTTTVRALRRLPAWSDSAFVDVPRYARGDRDAGNTRRLAGVPNAREVILRRGNHHERNNSGAPSPPRWRRESAHRRPRHFASKGQPDCATARRSRPPLIDRAVRLAQRPRMSPTFPGEQVGYCRARVTHARPVGAGRVLDQLKSEGTLTFLWSTSSATA